jgi:cytochrome c5
LKHWLLAVSVLCLTAAAAPAARRTAKAKPAAAAVSPFPRGVGQAQVTAACAACHPTTVITTKHYSEDKWAQLVEQMITRGAKVSDADFDAVVGYLVRNYGASKP